MEVGVTMKIEQVLEAVTEAIRLKRRYGPNFPHVLELSQINYNVEHSRIEMDLFEDGRVIKYDLLLDRVEEHGETSAPVDVEDGD